MEMDGITEAESEGKNLHLTHFEDSLIHGGYKGAEKALNIAAGLLDMLEGSSAESVNITTKWDGAPAIFAGINPETGKFVMGDKGIFAQTPRIMDTPDAIDQNKAEGQTAYRVSKSGVNSLTESFAMRHACYGIRVNAILPGLMETPNAVESAIGSNNITREELKWNDSTFAESFHFFHLG